LEEAVGVPLLSRTTRRVTLTDEGSRYYANALQILRLVEQAGDEARGTRSAPAGTIRISCTAAFGVLHVSRLVFAFQDRYPDIGIDLSLTDERIDLVREGVDVAMRLGPLSDSSMKLRSLGQSRRLLVAAPEYLAARGRPTTPLDLAGHEGIRMSNIAGGDMLSLRGRTARATRFRLAGVFASITGWGRWRPCWPAEASPTPIAGWSTICWPMDGWRQSCRVTSPRPFRSAC
jgi:DNA-binding transcriptional LysR family regulator